VGLLCDVTRAFREHGLSVTHAEAATRGGAAGVFYVVDAAGAPVQARSVQPVRAAVGEQVLFVGEREGRRTNPAAAAGPDKSPPDGRRRSLGNLIRSRSEKFLYNLGLTRSCS
jgi:hypothetical protein